MHIRNDPTFLLTVIDICFVHFYVYCRWYWGYNVPYVSNPSFEDLKPDNEHGEKSDSVEVPEPQSKAHTIASELQSYKDDSLAGSLLGETIIQLCLILRCGGWCHNLINVFLTYRMTYFFWLLHRRYSQRRVTVFVYRTLFIQWWRVIYIVFIFICSFYSACLYDNELFYSSYNKSNVLMS